MADAHRTCTGCKKTLPENDFYKKYHNDKGKYYFRSKCKPCINAENTERSRNSKSRQDYQRKYRLENKERINAQTKTWVDENKDRVRALSKGRYLRNREDRLNASKEWAEQNPELVRHYQAKNRADRLIRSVQWADDDRIKQIYSLRQTMSEYFKTDFHVDHIIPLKGRTVSGLHVHNNLQILTAEQNLSKGNKFESQSIARQFY